MNKIQLKIYLIIENNNGYISTEMAKDFNIGLRQLQRYANSGFLTRVAQGLYHHDDFERDLFYETQFRLPKGIFSYESSLYLQGLIPFDNERKINITIPSGWSSNLIKDKNSYEFHYIKEDLWELGQEIIINPNGNIVTVYDKERTLIELLKEDEDKFLPLVERYIYQINRGKIYEYAKELGNKTLMNKYFDNYFSRV